VTQAENRIGSRIDVSYPTSSTPKACAGQAVIDAEGVRRPGVSWGVGRSEG